MKISYRLALKEAKKKYREKYKERPPYFLETLIFLNVISWASRKNFTKKNSYTKIEYVSDDYIILTEENNDFKIRMIYYYNGRPWVTKNDRLTTNIVAKNDKSINTLNKFMEKHNGK